jgi:UDP-glucose 4-epimerase
MRVVITGATGNLGTSIVRSLAKEPRVTRIVGLARRPSVGAHEHEKVEYSRCDIVEDELVDVFKGAQITLTAGAFC